MRKLNAQFDIKNLKEEKLSGVHPVSDWNLRHIKMCIEKANLPGTIGKYYADLAQKRLNVLRRNHKGEAGWGWVDKVDEIKIKNPDIIKKRIASSNGPSL